MNTPKTPKKLTRAQITEGLDQIPVSQLLGRGVERELTAKQKKFAYEVARGATKADAYRRAYDVKSKHALEREPYQLTRDQRIANEIEAQKLAIEREKYRTPAILRGLVIDSIVDIMLNPAVKDSVKLQAAKVLGTVTEVAAFTERKEVRTIRTSEDVRAKLLDEIKAMTKAGAEDARITHDEAATLLEEIGAGPKTHPAPTPQDREEESRGMVHTIPHKQSPHEQSSIPHNPDPTPSLQEDPPVKGPKMANGVGD